MPKKQEPKKDRTDLTGRHDVTTEEIMRGLLPKKGEEGKPKSKWDKAASG